ncbi:MAG: RNA-dependent DNA polymerase [Chloroflexi bacterium]|jgi:RNA-directed DNA polymerase|nr:RNA-dependent DNA polymerase [Chloroflexota bacterium]
MAKRYYNLFDQIWHPLNLWVAYKKAACGKRSKPYVAAFEYDLEENLIDLEEELRTQTYTPGGYHNFYIQKPKRRLISAAPFRDRVVHHALMQVIEPLFERQFIHDSYANRVGKGTHRALDRCTYFLRRYRYVMHLDVRQFFPSIDHEILKDILSRTIGDEAVLELIAKIISSGDGVQAEVYEPVYFPGDDLFSLIRQRGLPIGNLTSQHWANVYLNEFDQHAKRVLKCRAYLRFVDDILLFGDDKSMLSEWRTAIIEFLQDLRLTIHETKAQPRPVHIGVPFLGFQIFPDHRRLKRRNGIAFRRRLRVIANQSRICQIEHDQMQASIQGWLNHASYGDTWGLRRAVLHSVGLDGNELDG